MVNYPPFENDDERIAALNKRIYAPRPRPTPIPSARWDECPLFCIAVNDEWLSHIIGALDVLDQPDTWIGAPEKIIDARNQVRELISAFMGDDPLKCCCDDQTAPILHRINPDTGAPEISIDGGTTWVPDPDSLPLSAIALPPPVTAGVSNTKCDAASNGLQHIKDIVMQQSTERESGASVTAVALAIATFIVGLLLGPEVAIPAFVAVIIAVINTIAALDAGIFENYWSSDVYDIILCAFYCHIKPDGSFDASGYQAAVNDMQSQLPNSAARDWLIKILQGIGLAGFNNLCAYGSSSDADCSSCDCACDLENWVSWLNGNGGEVTIIDDPTYGPGLEIVAHYNPTDYGLYGAAVTTNDSNVCCTPVTVTYSPTPTTGHFFWSLCGEEIPVDHNHFLHEGGSLPPTEPVCFIGRNNIAPFTMRLFFSGE